jgi:hypothetical protein
MTTGIFNTYVTYEDWCVASKSDSIQQTDITVQLMKQHGTYLDAIGGYMAHRLDEHNPATAAVDFNLQQATDLVFKTVTQESALPTSGVKAGEPCYATAESTLHICTSDS